LGGSSSSSDPCDQFGYGGIDSDAVEVYDCGVRKGQRAVAGLDRGRDVLDLVGVQEAFLGLIDLGQLDAAAR
jgi:hypothetical protein